MVAPIRPYLSEHYQHDSEGTLTYLRLKVGFRQLRPYSASTDFRSLRGTSTGGYDATCPESSSNSVPQSMLVRATNLAYERFVDALGDSSSFGATLTAERKETWATVVNVLTRLASSARQMKKGNFPKAFKTLGVPYREREILIEARPRRPRSRGKPLTRRMTVIQLPTGREVQKTAANGWLLWSYGIKPLAQDIYNAMDVLQRPLPVWQRCTGKGQSSHAENYSFGKYAQSIRYDYSVHFSAEVTVINPNLYLMNKLGLVNPAQWILEGIPGSFVLDWFSNLSSVVGSFTDFAGYEIRDPLKTSVLRWSQVDVFGDWNPPYRVSRSSTAFERLQTVIQPKIQIAYERFNWQRGLNAISLLTGFLPNK